MIAEPPIPDLGRVTASVITKVPATQFKLSAITGPPEQCLVGSVTLTGGRVSGDVIFQLPEAFMAKVGNPVAGPKRDERYPRNAADVTGELCNMLAGRVAATLAAAGYSSILSIQMDSRFIQAPKLAGATGLARDICSQSRCSSTSSRDEPKNSECGRQQGRADAFGPAVSPVRL